MLPMGWGESMEHRGRESGGQDREQEQAGAESEGPQGHALQSLHPNPIIAARMYRRGMARRQARQAEAAQAGPAAVPSGMSAQFGHNFDDVRLHTDAAANEQARSLGTEAVTQGNDIYFAEGAYDPGSAHGREVLGHELAHVVQQ